MTAQEIIATLREEIERLQPDAPKPRDMKSTDAKVAMLVHQKLNQLLSVLSDLEKSVKPIPGELDDATIMKEVQRIGCQPSEFDVARHFYDLGCRRTAEKYDEIEYNRQRAEASGSSEIPNDLKEAAEKEYPCDKSWMTDSMLDLNAHKQVAFWKGAKWQAEHAPLPEDTVLFNKGVEEGKRLMMEEAVEGEIMYNPYPTICLDDCKDYNPKDNQKVRIIIVKED